MTSKQRAYLRSLANSIDPIFQIGKAGLSENLLKQLDDAIEARELIKINVLESSGEDVKALGNEIADALMQAITFLANFNFITVLILPFLLMIYSIIAMVQKRKYGIILLLINICNCVLIFFT